MSKISSQKIQFIAYLASFLLLLLTFNNKTFLLAHLIIGLFFFFILKKSFLSTLVSLLLISFPFEVPIRFWQIVVTPPLFAGVPGSGYSIYLGLTLKIIFVLSVFLIFTLKAITKKIKIPSNHESITLLILILISFFNTAFFYLQDITTYYSVYRLWQAAFMFFIGQILATRTSHRSNFFYYLLALALFSGTIGTLQFINQKPFGRYIELTPSFSETGYDTGIDGPTQTRISGFISHPVYFGSFLSILIPIALGLTLYFVKKKQKSLAIISGLSIASCLVAGFGTLSRTVWINLGLTFLLFFPHLKKIIFYQRFTIPKKILPLFFIPIIPIFFVSNSFFTRLQSIPLLLNSNGNASIRIELIKQSLEMISHHPLIGVGPNRFTVELVNQYIPPNITGFIVVVHNTILIIFTEYGVPAGIVFVIFLLQGFISTFRAARKNLLLWGVWVGLATFIVSSQFHPLLNQDPTFELFMLLFGFLSICAASRF